MALAEEFLKRMERGEKFEDVVRELDKTAKQAQFVIKFIEQFPPGRLLSPAVTQK